MSRGDLVSLRSGTILNGKWLLGRVLTAGDDGTIFEATHQTNGKRVAVKVFHTTLDSTETEVWFQREASIANRVEHPGAARVLDDDVTEDGAPFFVMDRLDGDSLANVLRRAKGGISIAETLRVAYEVLDVLAVAHASGIFHRDIGPDTIFLTTEGKVKVLDFGFARILGARDAAKLVATPFMAPERAEGRWDDIDASSDVWAVGAIMFRLLSGKPPRPSTVQSGHMTSLGRTTARVSPEIVAIVDRALAADKSARWPDAPAMQRAIEESAPRVVERPSIKTLPLSPSKTPSLRFQIEPNDPVHKTKPVRYIVALFCAAVASLVVYWVTRPGPASAPASVHPSPSAETVHAAAPSASTRHEVELPSAGVEPLPTVMPEPVPVRVPAAHHKHRVPNAGDTIAPSAPLTDAPSFLDRRR